MLRSMAATPAIVIVEPFGEIRSQSRVVPRWGLPVLENVDYPLGLDVHAPNRAIRGPQSSFKTGQI